MSLIDSIPQQSNFKSLIINKVTKLTPNTTLDPITSLSIHKAIEILNNGTIDNYKAKLLIEALIVYGNNNAYKFPNKILYSLINSCLLYELSDHLKVLLNIVLVQKLSIQPFLLTKVLSFLCIKGYSNDSKVILKKYIEIGYEVVEYCFSPVIRYSKSCEEVNYWLYKMEILKIKPNVVIYSAAIKSFEESRDWKAALDILDVMKCNNIRPNEVTYTSLLNIMARSSKGKLALYILREMVDSGYKLIEASYYNVILSCARNNLWDETIKLLDFVIDNNMQISDRFFMLLISSTNNINNNIICSTEVIDKHITVYLYNKYSKYIDNISVDLYDNLFDLLVEFRLFEEIIDIHKDIINKSINLNYNSMKNLMIAYIHCDLFTIYLHQQQISENFIQVIGSKLCDYLIETDRLDLIGVYINHLIDYSEEINNYSVVWYHRYYIYQIIHRLNSVYLSLDKSSYDNLYNQLNNILNVLFDYDSTNKLVDVSTYFINQSTNKFMTYSNATIINSSYKLFLDLYNDMPIDIKDYYYYLCNINSHRIIYQNPTDIKTLVTNKFYGISGRIYNNSSMKLSDIRELLLADIQNLLDNNKLYDAMDLSIQILCNYSSDILNDIVDYSNINISDFNAIQTYKYIYDNYMLLDRLYEYNYNSTDLYYRIFDIFTQHFKVNVKSENKPINKLYRKVDSRIYRSVDSYIDSDITTIDSNKIISEKLSHLYIYLLDRFYLNYNHFGIIYIYNLYMKERSNYISYYNFRYKLSFYLSIPNFYYQSKGEIELLEKSENSYLNNDLTRVNHKAYEDKHDIDKCLTYFQNIELINSYTKYKHNNLSYLYSILNETYRSYDHVNIYNLLSRLNGTIYRFTRNYYLQPIDRININIDMYKSMKIENSIYYYIINACSSFGYIDKMFDIYKEMSKFSFQIIPQYYNLPIKRFSLINRLDLSIRLFQHMKSIQTDKLLTPYQDIIKIDKLIVNDITSYLKYKHMHSNSDNLAIINEFNEIYLRYKQTQSYTCYLINKISSNKDTYVFLIDACSITNNNHLANKYIVEANLLNMFPTVDFNNTTKRILISDCSTKLSTIHIVNYILYCLFVLYMKFTKRTILLYNIPLILLDNIDITTYSQIDFIFPHNKDKIVLNEIITHQSNNNTIISIPINEVTKWIQSQNETNDYNPLKYNNKFPYLLNDN